MASMGMHMRLERQGMMVLGRGIIDHLLRRTFESGLFVLQARRFELHSKGEVAA